MTLRTILYGSAAAAVLAVVSPMVAPDSLNPVATVQAASSISFSVFYDDLAPYGDWVSYHDGYVFVPADTGRDWRPYTVGRWVWTDDYGWTWVSEEEHGWATHHYGRWAFGDDIGWYWVPGSRWAPAWVSWRHSDDHVVWAPLPPDGDDPDLAINFSIGNIPDYYWVAVPTQSFLSINLSLAILHDDDERGRILRETGDEDRVRVRNDRMMNIAFDPQFIEQRTGEKVPRRDVRRSDRPGRADVSDDSVTVFNDDIRPDRDRKPKKVKEVKEVRRGGDAVQGEPDDGAGQVPSKRRKTQATQGDEQPVDDGQVPAKRKKQKATQGDEQPADDGQLPAKRRKNQATQGNDQPGVADVSPDGSEPVKAERRKKPPKQASQGDGEPVGKPVQRLKKPILLEEGGNSQAGDNAGTPKQQRRAKPARQAAEQPDDQGAPPKADQRKRQAAEQPVQGKKKAPAQRRKAKGCDPSVNPDCAAQ